MFTAKLFVAFDTTQKTQKWTFLPEIWCRSQKYGRNSSLSVLRFRLNLFVRGCLQGQRPCSDDGFLLLYKLISIHSPPTFSTPLTRGLFDPWVGNMPFFLMGLFCCCSWSIAAVSITWLVALFAELVSSCPYSCFSRAVCWKSTRHVPQAK